MEHVYGREHSYLRLDWRGGSGGVKHTSCEPASANVNITGYIVHILFPNIVHFEQCIQFTCQATYERVSHNYSPHT